MNVLIYEHMGAAYAPSEGSASLGSEGRAMREALISDLAGKPELTLVTVLHPSQPRPCVDRLQVILTEHGLHEAIGVAAQQADAAIVIAPESDGILAQIVESIEEHGCRLVGPDAAHVGLFSDKRRTARTLDKLSIPTLENPESEDAESAIVIKPVDGVGSQFVVVGPRRHYAQMESVIRSKKVSGPLLTQPYWPGLPASIALVVGECASPIILPAVTQRIEPREDEELPPGCRWLTYQGGSLPMAVDLDARARMLAEGFLWRFPDVSGYVGIDLILGSAPDGSRDRIVEVNPRLTTSYIGYRRLFGPDLACLLVGQFPKELPLPRQTDGPIQFDVLGSVFCSPNHLHDCNRATESKQ